MDTVELADRTADPIQILGQAFYFDSLTRARGKESGLNAVEYYGLGRGGTLGNVDVGLVLEAFHFFHPRFIERMWATDKAEPATVAADYVLAAYEYADRTFGAVDVDVLANFAASAHKVASAVVRGHHHLVDGYRQYDVPANPVHAAYLGCILMRELRGCVHIDAVNDVGLSAVEACYLQDPAVFTMHGYLEDETPSVTPEKSEKKVLAEEKTSAMMADCFSVLSDDERQHFADGALAMFAALQVPVAVS
jgi:helix-turn-helix protein